MPTDGDVMEPKKLKVRCPATIGVLVVTALVFGAQQFLATRLPDFDTEKYFALSLDGLGKGYVWQLLTFQFMHAGWLHILLNSWAIFIFGRVVEFSIGAERMLKLYFLSGIAGGLTQMLGSLFYPGLFGDGRMVGASAGAFGLIGAFAVMYPHQKLLLLLFFVIPLRLRARTLLWMFIFLALIGIQMPRITHFALLTIGFLGQFFPVFMHHVQVYYLQFDGLSGSVAHAAHLGGILTGCVMADSLLRSMRPMVVETAAGPKVPLKISAAQD